MSKADDLADSMDIPFLQIDGFDDCIIGTCDRIGQETILAYDYDQVIAQLVMDNDEWTYDDALEWFDFNIIGAGMGDSTPCFITQARKYDS